MRRASSAMAGTAALFCAAAYAAPARTAVCIIAPPPGTSSSNEVKGTITFTQKVGSKGVAIRVRVSGLSPNSVHGFHIHALGDLTQGCVSAGGHFNPSNKNHGGPLDAERHAGDLGNVAADGNGIIDETLSDSVITLDGASDFSVVGRSVVLHADAVRIFPKLLAHPSPCREAKNCNLSF